MVQVDVFWTFAIGSSFAAAASRQLKNEKKPYVNKYFVYTLVFLSVLFAPSGVYLLWAFPGWETMFMLDRNVHPSIPCIFAATNILFGILGWRMAYGYIKKGQPGAVHRLYLFGYAMMFGILGFGWKRFFYSGTIEEWRAGVPYSVSAWFTSDVALALLVMGVIIAPPLIYPYRAWPREGKALSLTTRVPHGAAPRPA
ncbi:MAG: hypothetical protein HYY13_03785 [Nitrospirae bacterium]|nr:hypothetical protein [Nitrospirota bacterium]